MRVVLNALSDRAEAVLDAIEGIADLMGDARDELPDAEHLLLLPHFRLHPLHVPLNGRRQVDRDPQGAGEGRQQPQGVDPFERV